MALPKPVRFAGLAYRSVGWALGDILRLEPLASDQRVGDILDVPPQTVRYWRLKNGIPPYKRRGPNPYLENSDERPDRIRNNDSGKPDVQVDGGDDGAGR